MRLATALRELSYVDLTDSEIFDAETGVTKLERALDSDIEFVFKFWAFIAFDPLREAAPNGDVDFCDTFARLMASINLPLMVESDQQRGSLFCFWRTKNDGFHLATFFRSTVYGNPL